ncbi:hypothetical protein TOPH_05845 [Tolypocladium ophioglossoides CBS 100239]|uniref:Uncharacterized protein n=1 Tax=Tolypocladium ophioglossoides (strain CBS 100239) TaxID=1163406 RepID=A0A0L0N5V9_TOLOC|nr:hypothetical protein TOPH_05845 [Tolypocladium ophioglossoides CBS 100239]
MAQEETIVAEKLRDISNDKPVAEETIIDEPAAQEETIIADEPRDISSDEPAAQEETIIADELRDISQDEPVAEEETIIDEPAAEEKTIIDEPAAEEETIVADEPSDISQDEPVATIEAVGVKDEPATLVPAAELSAMVDPEDMWSMPASSKDKKKKKKKKKGLHLDEPLPAEEEADAPPVAEEPAVETAKEPEQPAEMEPQPFTEPPVAEPEFAPVSKGKKKKKDKRKSVQWEPEEPGEPDNADWSLDVAAEDAVPFEPSSDQCHHHSASTLLPAAAIGAAGSVLITALDHDKTDQPDPVEQYDKEDIAFADAPVTAEVEEIPEEDNKQVVEQDIDQSRALESHISEPLFSQGDAPVEPTQEATSLEPTQADEPASEVRTVGDEPAIEATLDDFAGSKRERGKNGKKSQASVWDLIEDESVQNQETDPEAPTVDLAVEQPAEEPAAMALSESSKDIPDEQPLFDSREAEAEDEWSMPTTGKKPKRNKKKGSKYPSIAGQVPILEAIAETTEPIELTEEPASIDEPSTSMITDRPVQDSATADEWPQAQMSSTWGDEPATTAPSGDTPEQAETPAPTVDPEAEFEVPKKGKKGKKGKKKKNTFSWDSPDAEAPQDTVSRSQEPTEEPLPLEEQAATETEVPPQSEAAPTVDDAPAAREHNENEAVSSVEQGSDAPKQEIESELSSETLDLEASRELDAPEPTDAPPAEDNEFLFPVKMSKKDKKKKKKQAWMDEDVPSAQGTSGSATPEEGPAIPGEAGIGQSSGTSEQQLEATPDDEWGGFSLKKSKKDKKKKRAKNIESENLQESEIASPEPEPEKTTTAADQATEFSQNDNEHGIEAPLDQLGPVPVTELETPGQAGATEDTPISEEPEQKDEDEWSLGLSKKDRKEKKKEKTLESEAAESSPLSEEATIAQEPEVAKEAAEDNMWSGTVSKEDDEKKKKPELGSQGENLAETTGPAEDPMNIQDSPTTVETEREAAVDTATASEPLQDLEIKNAPSLDASGTRSEPPTADVVEGELKDIPATEPKETEGQREQEQVVTEVATDDSKHDQDSPAKQSVDAEARQVEAFAWEEPGAEGTGEAVEPSSEIPSVPVEEPTQEPPLADTDMAELQETIAPVRAPEDIEMRDAGQNVEVPSEDTLSTQVEEAKEPEGSDQQVDLTKDVDEPTSGTQSQDNASSEDPWEAMPQRKLSKKDKKKKKKQESLIEDPVEPAIEAPKETESTSPPEPAEADSPIMPEVKQDTPVFAQEISQEPEEWLSTKKSKKDKKAQKLALTATGLAAAGFAAHSITTEKNETREPPATEELSQFEPVGSWADETEETAPIVQPEDTPREPEPAQEDDGFAFHMPAKKKKGKKGKASLGAAELSSESGSTSEPERPAKYAAPGPWHSKSGGEVARDIHATEPELTSHAPDVPETTVADDEWAMSVKKKGKKGKKGKGSGTMTPANEPDVSALLESTEPTRDLVEATHIFEPAMEPIPEPVPEPAVPEPEEPKPAEPEETSQPAEDNDAWEFTTKKSKKGKNGSGTMTPANEPDIPVQPESTESTRDLVEETRSFEPTIEPVPEPEEPKFAEPEETPRRAEGNDIWASTTEKSNKGSGVVTPANEPVPPVESESAEAPREVAAETRDIEPAVETVVEQEAPMVKEPQELPQLVEATADDAWAFTTKKKGKKGKKGKSGSGTMTPTTGLDDQPIAVDVLPTEDKNETPPSAEAAATADSEPPRPTWIQEPTPPVEAEDEWAMPTKKKGKGKKKKGIPLSSLDEPTTQAEGESVQPELPQEPSSTEDQLGEPTSKDLDESQPMESTVAPNDNVEAARDAMEVEKAEDFTNAAKTAEPEPMALDEAPALVDDNPDETWGTPVKKKSKKDKKRKSSQVMILDSPPDDPAALEETPAISSQEQDRDTPMADKAGQEQPASEDWLDDFSVPKANSSVSKTKKKKKKKSVELPARAPVGSQTPQTVEAREVPVETAIPEPTQEQVEEIAEAPSTEEPTYAGADAFDDVWESDPRLAGKGGMDVDESTLACTGTDAFDDVWDSDPNPGLPGKGLDQSMSLTETEISRSKAVEDEHGENSGPSTAGAAAAASAVAGGVALLAERFGGGKKKKKGKQKKIVDKRQPQEEDIFDDPALWESADKKSLQTEVKASTGEDFWGGGDEKAEKSRTKEALPMLMSESFTESEEGWKETARQGAPLDDYFTESPVLGRGETALVRAELAGLLRRGSEVEEPVGGLLREARDAPATLGSPSPAVSEFRRSPTRALAAVEEVPEAEAEAAKYDWPTPEMNRDSGFAADSPDAQRPRPRSNLFSDEPQRDSGRRLRPPPYGTPVLREPAAAEATPEPEKRAGKKKKSYGELAAATALGGGGGGGGGGAAAAAAAIAAAIAATAATAASRQHHDGQGRSASDGQQLQQLQQLQQPLRAEPGPLAPRRSASNTSLSRHSRTPEPLRFRPESPGIGAQPTPTPTPPLRRVDRRMSGDLRALRQQSSTAALTHDRDKDRHSQLPGPASSPPSPPPPVANERRVRASRDPDRDTDRITDRITDRDRDRDNDMADVYDGFGEGRIGSPRSPTRPHSMRRRQSMQVLELESRVEQLVAENRLLTDARAHAEQNLSQRAAAVLSDRDAEIEALRQSLQFLQNEVTRLSEVNEGLASANAELASKDTGRYADVSRELNQARGAHSAVNQTLEQKDAEIADLRAQLDAAKDQIRAMQRQILDSKAGDSDFLTIHDEDYFDNRCQQLCSHVQQWVLRFSKFSDMRACRLTSEINDEKTIDRLDNAVLDGSDVDAYLNDRVKRRDIFMSMTMNMIWEFVFTRYLFGMDREQRQKLKSLEKLLTDVGPVQAVRQWRAVTLTLLSKRDNFKDQRELDTEAVVQAIFQTLCKILPPPGNLESQIQSQLRRVMREAVDLSIAMRTQRAEYMMLPPLQPEYDADGELAATVQFDASMMNERSGSVSLTNEELESQGAVVRVVLFPLVVKRGDDAGVGEDKIVVCPAQVLIARDKGNRYLTPSSDAGGASLGAPSRISVVTEATGQPGAEYLESSV